MVLNINNVNYPISRYRHLPFRFPETPDPHAAGRGSAFGPGQGIWESSHLEEYAVWPKNTKNGTISIRDNWIVNMDHLGISHQSGAHRVFENQEITWPCCDVMNFGSARAQSPQFLQPQEQHSCPETHAVSQYGWGTLITLILLVDTTIWLDFYPTASSWMANVVVWDDPSTEILICTLS